MLRRPGSRRGVPRARTPDRARPAGVDEHGLRARLLDGASRQPLSRTSSSRSRDQAADARGLWPADYDLLARHAGRRARSTSLATEEVLGRRLPPAPARHSSRARGGARRRGRLAAGAGGSRAAAGAAGRRAGSCRRDREEELADFVARAQAARRSRSAPPSCSSVRCRISIWRAGVRGRAGAVSGARRAAAGGRAVRRGARSRVQRDVGGHACAAGRAARLAALALRRRRRTPIDAGGRARARRAAARDQVPGRLGAARGAGRRAARRRRPHRPAGCGARRSRALQAAAAAARELRAARGADRLRRRSSGCSPSSRRTSGCRRTATHASRDHLRARAAVLGALQALARRARRARRRAAARDRAGRHGAPLDRRADVLAAYRRRPA